MERLSQGWRHCYKFPVPSELAATLGMSPGTFFTLGTSPSPSGALGPAFCCLHGKTRLWGSGDALGFAAWSQMGEGSIPAAQGAT